MSSDEPILGHASNLLATYYRHTCWMAFGRATGNSANFNSCTDTHFPCMVLSTSPIDGFHREADANELYEY
eukprot:scaffold40051_cov23-Prasinocladus_malaysianus.AAC.2